MGKGQFTYACIHITHAVYERDPRKQWPPDGQDEQLTSIIIAREKAQRNALELSAGEARFSIGCTSAPSGSGRDVVGIIKNDIAGSF